MPQFLADAQTIKGTTLWPSSGAGLWFVNPYFNHLLGALAINSLSGISFGWGCWHWALSLVVTLGGHCKKKKKKKKVLDTRWIQGGTGHGRLVTAPGSDMVSTFGFWWKHLKDYGDPGQGC